MKKAYWVSRRITAATPTARRTLVDARHPRRSLGAYQTWLNHRAEEEADKVARAIEEKAIAAGYEIVENPNW